MTRKKERFRLRVIKGGIVPDDGYTRDRMNGKYRVGDVVLATLHKPRNPGFNRYVHAFCKLLSENIEDFEDMDSHRVLKALQIASNAYCYDTKIIMPGLGTVIHRIPESISFDSMNEAEFQALFEQLTEYVIKTYWPDSTPVEIAKMAGMVDQCSI